MATSLNVLGAMLTRRQFVKAGGALFVGFGLVGRDLFERTATAATAKHSLNPSLSSSWFEIHADNTIVMRTGKVDFGSDERVMGWIDAQTVLVRMEDTHKNGLYAVNLTSGATTLLVLGNNLQVDGIVP